MSSTQPDFRLNRRHVLAYSLAPIVHIALGGSIDPSIAIAQSLVEPIPNLRQKIAYCPVGPLTSGSPLLTAKSGLLY